MLWQISHFVRKREVQTNTMMIGERDQWRTVIIGHKSCPELRQLDLDHVLRLRQARVNDVAVIIRLQLRQTIAELAVVSVRVCGGEGNKNAHQSSAKTWKRQTDQIASWPRWGGEERFAPVHVGPEWMRAKSRF
jgi:hypothetical protein